MFLVRCVCSLLLIVGSCRPLLADEAPLPWKFQVGDEHRYRMTQQLDMSMVHLATDRQTDSGVGQILDMTWKIAQVDDHGTATILLQVDRVQLDIQAPGEQEMHFDSQDKKGPTGFAAMMAPLAKTLTQEPIQLTMTPRGEVKQLKTPTALSAAKQKNPKANLIGEMFLNESFKNMIQRSSVNLPENKTLQPGLEWTTKSQTTNAQLGEIKVLATYGYQGTREVREQQFEVFNIGLEMDFSVPPGSNELEVVQQESSGEILFSREQGRLESSQIKQNLQLNIASGEHQLTQTVNQSNKLERLQAEK